MTLGPCKWLIAEGSREVERTLQTSLKLSPVIARLLLNRGARDVETASQFLDTPLKTLEDPLKMADMGKAVGRIIQAFEKNEKVVVFGDYDVDGVTSTALLLRFFGGLGMSVGYRIPERAREGYGLSVSAVNDIASEGAHLIITVDNGIMAFDAIDRACKLGLDVIVTDHHLPGATLPSAYAVLDPNRKDCDYPCKELAGVGIAFKLCMAIRGELHRRGMDKDRLPNLKRLLDIVAVGSIADMSKLTGENRTLVRHGLFEIEDTSKVGLKALKAVSSVNSGAVTARDIGFGLAPRLNAAGRLGKADVGVELLKTKDKKRAEEIAGFLDKENSRRKDIQLKMFCEAEDLTLAEIDTEKDMAIALGSDNWNAGIAGIVASKILERWRRPVALVCFDGDEGRGSARSIPGFNLADALGLCADTLERFGGHELAAGFTVKREKFEDFKAKFISIANESIKHDDLQPTLLIDGVFDPNLFTLEIVAATSALEPFGQGFPHPVFASLGVVVSKIRTMGSDGKHVRLTLKGGAEAVGFSMAERFVGASDGAKYDIAYTPEINIWQNTERVQLRLIDIKPHN